jgi:uncharacterized 2Fe-2S/4Fe-4S cluster protein (DUF4445 family)
VHLDDSLIAEGVRLACRCTIEGEGIVRLLEVGEKGHRILAAGVLPEFTLAPNITKRFVDLRPSSFEERSRDDLGRLARRLEIPYLEGPPLALLRDLPIALRSGDSGVTVVFAGDSFIGIEPGDTTSDSFGVAVDIGTTTIVASLIDLGTGRELAAASMINPQKEFGLDVLTRIHHVKELPTALEKLSFLVRKATDTLIGDVCADAEIDRNAVCEIAVAANTTMTHLFLGVDCSGLGSAPYAPVFTSAVTVPAGELSLSVYYFGLVNFIT